MAGAFGDVRTQRTSEKLEAARQCMGRQTTAVGGPVTARDPQEVLLDTSLPGDAPKPLRAHQRLLRVFVTVDSSSKCGLCRLSLTGSLGKPVCEATGG